MDFSDNIDFFENFQIFQCGFRVLCSEIPKTWNILKIDPGIITLKSFKLKQWFRNFIFSDMVTRKILKVYNL